MSRDGQFSVSGNKYHFTEIPKRLRQLVLVLEFTGMSRMTGRLQESPASPQGSLLQPPLHPSVLQRTDPARDRKHDDHSPDAETYRHERKKVVAVAEQPDCLLSCLGTSGTKLTNFVVTLAGRTESLCTLDVDSCDDSFIDMLLATIPLKNSQSLDLLVSIKRSNGAEWNGLDITLEDVSNTRSVLKQTLSITQSRGNGYSSNPHGPLTPNDYGVHSHPDTSKLLKSDSDSA